MSDSLALIDVPSVALADGLSLQAKDLGLCIGAENHVRPEHLGEAVQSMVNWICRAHRLLDVCQEEKHARHFIHSEEELELNVLHSLLEEERDGLLRDCLDHDQRRALAAAAIRKYYGKALQGEALLRSMMETQQQLSAAKLVDVVSSDEET